MKKMMMKARFFKAFIYKWRKLGSEIPPSTSHDDCCWDQWSCFRGNGPIPKDVPKGHLVVYVGEDYKRFVIRVTFLEHPLFRELLDRARDEYEFTPDSKLCIPCDENLFLNVIHRVRPQCHHHNICLCF